MGNHGPLGFFLGARGIQQHGEIFLSIDLDIGKCHAGASFNQINVKSDGGGQ